MKSETETSSKKDFYDGLPRKRNAVGVLIFSDDKMLILKPMYKDSWLVPGGVVEKGESIFQASVRECQEEIGVVIEITKLLVVDYKPGNLETGDAIHFLFLGHLPNGSSVVTDGKKIGSFKWTSPEEGISLLGHHLASRVKAGLEAIYRNQTVYCEDGIIRV